MKKLILLLKIHWGRILVIGFFALIFLTAIFLTTVGVQTFFKLESFSRQQIMAQYGMLLIIFTIVQLFTLPFYLGMHYYLMQGGLLGRIGSEKITKARANIRWDDVIGMENAKKEAWEIVKLLRDRQLLKVIGGKIVKGTLMVGPPGCGKTYLAKAIATECNLPMLSAVGSEFVGIFVGQGAAQMKSLFKQARAMAQMEGGCIIFIDEIDSFARPRMADFGFGGGISHNATINQFLTELDGLRQTENNVVVIAATNVPESELDAAIMRAGRFDRKIYVTRPNLKERKEIFDFYLKKVKTDSSINSAILARKALWFTPSDIDAMVREAGLIALRDNHREILSMKDLSIAYDRVVFGDKANIVLTQEDKKWTAYHEAGHAILAYLIHPKDDVIKATIIPRKSALGFVAHRPSEESYSHNKEYLLAQIKISVASYVAEKLIFGSTSSGVGGGPGSDFHTALSIARNMVFSYGMGQSGLVGEFQYDGHWRVGLLSEKVKETLDNDVQQIMQQCLKEVTEILSSKKDLLEHFAQALLKKEELEYDEIQAIFDQFNLKPLSGRVPLKI